jgi:hypothetical protein
MTTSRNPEAEPPGAPETQEDRQRLFEEWVTTLRRKGQNGVKPPVPLAVQAAIRSSAPPPAGDEGKTQVYRVPEEDAKKIARENAERVEAAALAALDIAQTQVYRIPEKVVTRAKALEQAQRAHAPRPAPTAEIEEDRGDQRDPDAIPTDRPPNMPTEDHTAVFVPPPDLLARAQRRLEALAAEEASRATPGDSTTGEPADLSLIEALAAVEAEGEPMSDPARLSPAEPPQTKHTTSNFAAQKAPKAEIPRSARPVDPVGDDSLANELASLRPRYMSFVGWTCVALLLAGVAYAVMTTLR